MSDATSVIKLIQLQTFNNWLILATLLSALVDPITFTFAVLVMPGIGELQDREYRHAFRTMDGMIQQNPPSLVLLWAGAIGALLLGTVLGMRQLEALPQ